MEVITNHMTNRNSSFILYYIHTLLIFFTEIHPIHGFKNVKLQSW